MNLFTLTEDMQNESFTLFASTNNVQKQKIQQLMNHHLHMCVKQHKLNRLYVYAVECIKVCMIHSIHIRFKRKTAN